MPLLLHDVGASGTTVAVGATVRGMPIGLALAGPLGGEVAALHGIVVAPPARRRGVGTGLLQALEAAVRGRGVRRLVGAHHANRPDSEAIVRLLARARFERVRSVVELVFTVSRLIQAPVLGVSCRGAEVVSYTTERMAPLLAMREPSRIDPATIRAEDNDADLATVVAIDGQVAACALARRAGPDTAYLSLLFVRPELRRRRWLAAFILKRFLDRLVERGSVT